MQDQLITVLAIVFFALVAALISGKVKQPVILAFLLIGAIIGPHTLNFVKDETIINAIIEIGAALLLFTIGLEFDLNKIKKLGTKSILISVFKIGIIFFIAYHIFSIFFDVTTAALLAIIVSFSSTIIIIKILESRNMLVRQEIPTLIAILIIEDLIAVTLLTLIQGFGKGNANVFTILEKIFNSLFILILIFIVFLAILRPIFRRIILKDHNESVIIFTALSMLILFSYIAHLLGFSFSLGAFLAGSLIASLAGTGSASKGFHHAISPYTFLFTSLFFIAIGTLVDLAKIWEYKYIILGIIAVVIVTRLIAVGLLTYLFSSFKGEQTFFSSIIMISVGEFSLLIAKEGMAFGTGLDLVTITSVIIFLSALLMSFTLNYATSAQGIFSGNKVHGTIKVTASYIKDAFEALDTENTYTASFKKHTNIIAGLLIAFLIFVNLIFAFSDLPKLLSPTLLATIIYYAIGIGILGFLGYLMYKQSKIAHYNLSVILANQSFTRNVQRSKNILKAALASFFFIIIGLFLPLFIFLAHLPKVTGIASLLFVAIGIYIFRNNFQHINSSMKDNQYPKAEKLNTTHYKKYKRTETTKQ